MRASAAVRGARAIAHSRRVVGRVGARTMRWTSRETTTGNALRDEAVPSGGGVNEDANRDDASRVTNKRDRDGDRRLLGVTGLKNYVQHGTKLMADEGEYGELELAKAGAKGVRVRQHVNPLTSRFQEQAPAPTWTDAFDDVTRALTIDVGCAGGRFDLLYAKRNPERNVLGVDIREPLVERGLSWGEASGVSGNVHFATCNATVSIGEWIKNYQSNGAEVELVTILHPDPHFKKRHRKRRIVQERLVRSLAEAMKPGTRVYLQSDVEELTEDMRDKFERYGEGCFDLDPELYDVDDVREKAAKAAEAPVEKTENDGEDDGWRSTWVHGGWLSENPIGTPSERELQTLGEGLPVFRVMLRRTENVANQ